jgi:hypothetical protein
MNRVARVANGFINIRNPPNRAILGPKDKGLARNEVFKRPLTFHCGNPPIRIDCPLMILLPSPGEAIGENPRNF